MKFDEAREYALTLPETTEEPHFERTSFRVRGKIFATAKPDGEELNLMFSEVEAEAIAKSHPQWCKTLPWGRQIAGVQIRLSEAHPERVRELLLDAWHRWAPKRLAARLGTAPAAPRARGSAQVR